MRAPPLLLAFAVVASLLVASDWAVQGPWLVPLKPVPVLLLALWTWRSLAGRRRAPLVAGLVVGAAGDFVLALAKFVSPATLFLSGLGLFLVGHLCYVAWFWPDRRWRPVRLPAVLVAYGAALGMSLHLRPFVREVTGPIDAYALALGTMAALAGLRRSPRLTVYAGAALFVCSDALIAQNVFVARVPLASVWILSTYFAAQFLIAWGSVRESLAER